MKALFCGSLPAILLLVFVQSGRAQGNEECLACHSDPSLAMHRGGKEVSLYVNNDSLQHSVHESLGCIDCHQGFNPSEMPHVKVIKPVSCQTCHDVGAYEGSVHGEALGAEGCSDCHGTHNILAPSNPDSRVNRQHIVSTCGPCHQDEDDRYSRSAHGTAVAGGELGAPSCADCHGAHTIVPVSDPRSVLYKTREPAVCLRCHVDNQEVRRRVGIAAGFIAGYEESIHGVALSHGDLKAPTCSNCHGAHDVTLGSNPNSRVSKFKVPDTCGRCHGQIVKTYFESIHGTALKSGNEQAPNCTDCHGEHQIFAPTDPRSRVSGRNVSARVCAVCHSSVMLAQKYGLASERFRSFEDSYHGLASKEGSVQVANCASCHGYHDVKPSSDPTSTINKANLPATCGKCHQGANENFTRGDVHVIMSENTEPVLYWVRTIYIALIIVTIGGMFVHNVFDFVTKSKLRLAIRRGLIRPEHFGPRQYLRMTLNERIQHGVLAFAFITLVITGFMLKFPDAWWVSPIRQWSERLFAIRGITHRAAGVLLIAAGIYHLYYILFPSRGRRLVRDLMPRFHDLREFWAAGKYYLGLSRSKPRFGRFCYIEKAEYWALIWGTIVMGVTGIVLWFNNYFIGMFTLLGWNVAQAIHYYEAILATLAILVWHFYFTIFNPNIYPMNASWITGTLSEEEMADEHPRELEQILSQEMEQNIDESADELRSPSSGKLR